MAANKHVLIVESDSVVGSAVAQTLQVRGWDITTVAQGNDRGADYSCNLQNRAEVAKLVSQIESERGPVYGLLVAKKFDLPGPSFLQISPEQWNEKLAGWLGFAVNICNACGKLMVERKEGRIMVLTPDFKDVEGDCIIEATAAGALHGFLKSFGAEAATDYVCVNGIYAALPFDLPAISGTCNYLLAEGAYVSAQLISIAGRAEGGCHA